MSQKSDRRIALVLKGYPRLSETFIAQEILELERAGYEISIISLRHPTDKHTHPVHSEIRAEKHYLPEYLLQEPLRVLKGKFWCFFKPGYWKVTPIFLRDLLRDPTPNRIRRFGQAMVMAREYVGNCDHIYVHFLHTPGSVARYASIITGKPFSVSAHAKDIWTIPEWEIREKLADCDWLVTCTQGGAEYLETLAPDGRVNLVYHGLDLSRFPPPPERDDQRDGSSEQHPIRLMTVGRAVAKKGIDTLLHALAALPENLHWRWTHIGGGPLKQELQNLADELDIAQRCEFRGALPQKEVLETYRKTDIFILPSRIDETGDRDGLPNVIVEAQSQRLPVLSTNISGIPELIKSGENGVLIEPDDVKALTSAIEQLSTEPRKRVQMGEAGEKRVRGAFSHKQTIGELIGLLERSMGSPR
ncbi:MAG: glycosyltransferase family 4 protein [Pseudomonadota bacterium]